MGQTAKQPDSRIFRRMFPQCTQPSEKSRAVSRLFPQRKQKEKLPFVQIDGREFVMYKKQPAGLFLKKAEQTSRFSNNSSAGIIRIR